MALWSWETRLDLEGFLKVVSQYFGEARRKGQENRPGELRAGPGLGLTVPKAPPLSLEGARRFPAPAWEPALGTRDHRGGGNCSRVCAGRVGDGRGSS